MSTPGECELRIAVIGAGGLGGYYGALLVRAGEDLTFIARGATLEVQRAQGLTLKSPRLGDHTDPVQAASDPAEVGPVDLVLVAVKTYDLAPVAGQLRPLVGPETTVLPVQNGVDVSDAFLKQTWTSVTKAGPTIRSPMYYDLLAGRRLEIEALHGMVVRLGLATPLSFAIYAAQQPYANGAPPVP